MQTQPYEPERDPAALWMEQLAALPPSSATLPTAESLWWRAEALRRLDAQRRLTAKLEIGERIQLGCVVAAALVFFIWLLDGPMAIWDGPALASVAGALLVAIVAVLLALDVQRRKWGPQR